MREILEALLTREGYRVRLAGTAEEGLELARSVPFDAAIVDVMLPGMDGITALDELKKINDEMPVLMITAFASVESASNPLSRGFSGALRTLFQFWIFLFAIFTGKGPSASAKLLLQ